MTDLRKAAEMALEALETLWDILDDIDTASDMAKENDAWYRKRVEALQKKRWDTMITTDGHKLKGGPVEALRQALAEPTNSTTDFVEPKALSQTEQKTPLKVLNLTVFTENRLRNGRVYDVETLQAMTNRDILAIPDMGKKALKEVMEALDVYAVNMSQDRVDETAKREHEPVAYLDEGLGAFYWPNDYEKNVGFTPLYAVPPHRWSNVTDEALMQEVRRRGFVIRDAQIEREWVGLTVNEARKFYEKYTNREELIYAIDKFLEEKNG